MVSEVDDAYLCQVLMEVGFSYNMFMSVNSQICDEYWL